MYEHKSAMSLPCRVRVFDGQATRSAREGQARYVWQEHLSSFRRSCRELRKAPTQLLWNCAHEALCRRLAV